jgi:hypothetical protein
MYISTITVLVWGQITVRIETPSLVALFANLVPLR